MNVKFKDGTVKNCSAPTEQKLLKSGESAGWILSFSLLCNMTSDEVDCLFSNDNFSSLTFMSENKTDVDSTILLSGYDKVSSVVIRHSDEQGATRVELHLTRGV